jgi:hypothetical protein
MTPPATAQANVGQQGWQADCPRCVASKFTCDDHFLAAAFAAAPASPAPASNEAPKQGGVTLYREIDALGGTGDGEWSEGYSAALGDVLTLMDARGFSEHVEAVPATGWQAIETAPKEHLARFLAYAEPRSDSEQVIYEVTRYDDKWGNQIRLNDGYGTVQERDILSRLSHWMPLPSAPAPGAAK